MSPSPLGTKPIVTPGSSPHCSLQSAAKVRRSILFTPRHGYHKETQTADYSPVLLSLRAKLP